VSNTSVYPRRTDRTDKRRRLTDLEIEAIRNEHARRLPECVHWCVAAAKRRYNPDEYVISRWSLCEIIADQFGVSAASVYYYTHEQARQRNLNHVRERDRRLWLLDRDNQIRKRVRLNRERRLDDDAWRRWEDNKSARNERRVGRRRLSVHGGPILPKVQL